MNNPTLRLSPPPFKIKMVESIEMTTLNERKDILRQAGYNIFNIPAEKVYIDLLTDSGTSAMSDHQWSGIMLGDESYAQCKNFFHLEAVVKDITGFDYVIPTHQGRSAENLLCYALNLDDSKISISNQFFDTTRANIEVTGSKAIDLVVPEAFDTTLIYDFKGNMNISKLEKVLKENANIALIIITVTNNAGGGQPVSLSNIETVGDLAKQYKIPFFIDAARFAENAYFIKLREEKCKHLTPKQIAKQVFSNADGCLMSAKKDGLVNIGGFIALNDKRLYQRIKERMVITEGFPSYGGLAGRDLEALARGLVEVLKESYLEYRHNQLKYLEMKLKLGGIPILLPVGGHSVNLDALRFLPHIPQSNYPGWALSIALYEFFGIRSVEIGSVMFSYKNKQGIMIYPDVDLVRLAIPRRVYSREHLDYICDSIIELYKMRENISGVKITYDPGILRHFNARFEPISE
ncbi:MAG: tryptophanase [Candidatus Hodarchaeales archaeon]|jgi:tryptophanase